MSDAARAGVDILINDNPIVLKVLRKPLVDGGMGQQVLYGEPVQVAKYKCRISRDPGGLLHETERATVGLVANSDYYLVAPWFAKIEKNDILEEPNGDKWRCGVVTQGKASGKPFITKCPLEKVR